ncbi:unnamed protein product [Calypogeia fissa]
MERRPHIGEALWELKASKGSEAVTVCDGRVKTGAQFVDRIAALSTGLCCQLGLQSGDRVAIAALNSDWYLEWLLAVPCAGGIIAPLNHRWSVEEASAAIRDIEARILVVDDQCLSWPSVLKARCPSLTRIVYIGGGSLPEDTDNLTDVESIIRASGPEPELVLRHAPHSIALICFTSGTTGRPKGVSLSHNALIVQSEAKMAVVGYSHKDVYLHTATMCHIGGISSALATVMANGSHIILPKFLPETVFETIDKHSVSTMIVVPSMLNDMISHWDYITRTIGGARKFKSFPTVATILNGAGSLSSSQLGRIKYIFPASKIMSAYGMTEACSSMTFLLLHDPKPSLMKEKFIKDLSDISIPKESKGWKTAHLGGVCVGKPAPHVEIRINPQKKENYDRHMIITTSVTATKETESYQSKSPTRSSNMGLFSPKTVSWRRKVSPSEERLTAGNVLTRGAHVMDGYWGQPVQTKDTLYPDGWMDTGDVGWIDEWGQLWLLGRQKDVIKTGGENVYASEVESVLGRHPAVLAAASVGIPDIRLGEAVAAMVRIREGWRWDSGETAKDGISRNVISETLLRLHCQQQGLSRYKVPRVIVMQQEPFPTTSTGKVKKDQVRSLITAQLEQRHSSKEKPSPDSKHSQKIRTFIRSRL